MTQNEIPIHKTKGYTMKENWPQYSSIALGINNSRDDHYISKGIPVHI